MTIAGRVLWSARVSGFLLHIGRVLIYIQVMSLDKAKESCLVQTLNSLISEAVKLNILI